MAFTKDARGYHSGNFILVMDDQFSPDWIFGYEGGHGQGEIVEEKMGPDSVIHKHVSGIKYEDISVTLGTSVSKPFMDWIKVSFGSGGTSEYLRKGGALVALDPNYLEITRLEFANGLITELNLPALDAASKEGAKLGIKISPEYTRLKKGDGSGKYQPATNQKAQKQWTAANFRVSIPGLDCTRVSKVEALNFKKEVAEVPLGDMRDPYREPVRTRYSNFVLTMPESHADTFHDWYEDFVIKGNCGAEKEKDHCIVEYLHTDLKSVVATVTGKQMGIFKYTPDKSDSNAQGIRSVKVEMYCETMEAEFANTK